MLKTLLWIITAPIWFPLAVICIGATAAIVYMFVYGTALFFGTGFFFLLYYFDILQR
jgi:hypothetical protein